MGKAKLKLKITLDLADFFSRGDEAVIAALGENSAIRINANTGDLLNVAAPETSFGTKLPAKLRTVAELVAQAIRSMDAHMKGKPDWYPANRFPFGCADFEFTYFAEGEAPHSWYIQGSWSEKSQARTPANLTSERAIERFRDAPKQKALVSSQAFPDLKLVYLGVEPSGNKLSVRDAYATKAEFDASGTSLRCIEYPAARLPTLSWDHHLFRFMTPVTQALQTMSLQRASKPADWLRSCSREAVFVARAGSRPATDLRASLVSGPKGPAPLPDGLAWPCCSGCGQRTLFSQSLDFRDLSFAPLLPGTTAVVFFCIDCHERGNWNTCAEVVWLGESQKIILTGEGSPSDIVQLDQHYGLDRLRQEEMPPHMLEELERLAELPNTPGIWMPQSDGTKAGGVPSFLQHDAFFFDRTGVRMEYVGQIGTPDHIPCNGFGYLFFSVKTGETYVEFQDT